MQATTRSMSASCLLLLTLAAAVSCLPAFQLERRSAGSEEPPVVVGKFKAPAPERMLRARLPKSSEFGSQTMSASYRIGEHHQDRLPEKIVHGFHSSSAAQARSNQNQRTVGAKIQVSDEGLNYPPSKLSADIYGNVAEIVTAPPEAVDQEFLTPQMSKLFGGRRSN